jgi:hypothetical protein
MYDLAVVPLLLAHQLMRLRMAAIVRDLNKCLERTSRCSAAGKPIEADLL